MHGTPGVHGTLRVQAVRAFFYNRTVIQMKQPDENDLAHMAESPGLPSPSRPFWLSFVAAARQTTRALQPKMVGGVPLSGAMLAAIARSLVDQLNEDAPVSLHSAVGGVLQESSVHQ